MVAAVGNEHLDLHGILVGAASGIVMRAYRALFEALQEGEMDPTQRLKVFDREVPWQESLEKGLRPFIWKMREEMTNRVFDRAMLADRLEVFRRSKREILALAFPILDELASAVEALRGFGYPFSPVELGIRNGFFLLPFHGVRFLRDRYSSFDLAYELGTDRVMSQEAERYAREW
jgi:hypothetical protein